MFDKWYQPYEVVVGFERVRRIQVPREAFREAVANALLHRRFDLNGAVQISMHENRIEVLSPGGLPEGISETAYLYSQLSLPRNLTIAEVFHRLHIIEKFGTGIDRIRNEYEAFEPKPQFEVTADYIRVVLPVVDYMKQQEEVSLENQIMTLLANSNKLSRREIEMETGYKKTRVYEALQDLIEKGHIEQVGSSTNTRYQLKS